MVSGGRSARDREREEAVRGFEKAMEEANGELQAAVESGSGEFTLEEIAENWITLLGGVALRANWVSHEGCFVRLRSHAHGEAISEAVHFHRPSDAEAFADWVLGKLRLENADFEHLRRI